MATAWMFFVFLVYFISLSHVKIFAEFENVALHKRAYQSSYSRSRAYNASLAVDGETTQHGNNFIHTAVDQPYTWWEVDLGKLYFVHEVILYLRSQSKKRRPGVEIYTNTAVNSSNTGHLCGTVTGRQDGSDIPDVVNFTCNINAGYVTVYQGTNNGEYTGTTLNIIEVEVYGCELRVKYGSNCDKLCEERHCVNTHSSCDVQTGTCDTAGCTAGWTGTDCTKQCGSGSDGSNCNFTCGHCTNGACDFVTGHCKDGCHAGYLGPLCKEKCGFGKYGSNCNFTCGHCTNGACDFVTGHCKDGCNAGYLGRFCDERIVASQDQAVTISGYTLGVVAIIVLMTILLFVIKRRRHMSSKESIQVKWSWKSKNKKNDHSYESAEVGLPTGQIPDRKQKEACDVTLTINSPVEEIDEQEVETAASVYYNVSDAQLPKGGVLVSELSTVIDNIRKQPGGFDTEFKKLENGFTSPYKESQIQENRPKNRFKGYYPYDKNRVVLTMQTDVPHSDYINASHIDSYTEKDYFIAAQAPNKKTLIDFWRMLWEKKCSKIIMLCKPVEDTKVKCEAYWSDEEMKTIGPFTVVVTDKVEKRDFVIRKIYLTHRKTGKTLTFRQFHFITWPDHGIPNVHDFIEFLYQARKSKPTLPGPVLVHCSAGVGRTGTYIALNILLDEMEATGKADIFKVITRLRDQRKGLVQTKEQYEMLFVALREMAAYGDTSMDNTHFYLKYQQQKTSLVMGKKTIDQLGQEIASLNEISYIGNPDKYRVCIDGQQDCFAMSLPSKVSRRGYLLIPDVKLTEESFWKLVIENDSYTIITLNSQTGVSLIPSKNESVKHGKVTVTTLQQTSATHKITEKTLHVEPHDEKEKRQIHHYYIHGWLPTIDSGTLITCLTTISEKLQQEKSTIHPVTVVYRQREAKNAIKLCIANNILFGTKLDTEVEIFNNIRRFQTILPKVRFTKDDFVFFCNLASFHIESSSVYANYPTSHN